MNYFPAHDISTSPFYRVESWLDEIDAYLKSAWKMTAWNSNRTSAALVPQRSYFVFSMFFSLLITSVHPFPHPNASLLRAKTLDFAHYYIIALKASYQFFYLLIFFNESSHSGEATARKTCEIFSYSIQSNQMMMKYSLT